MDDNMSLTVYDKQNEGNRLTLVYKNETLEVSESDERKDLPDTHEGQNADMEISDEMKSEIDDITFLGLVREYYPYIIRVFLTGQGTLKNPMNSINYPQIFSYLTNLWSSKELKGTISRAFGPYNLSMDNFLQRIPPEQSQELPLINTNLKNMIEAPSVQVQEFVRDGVIMLASVAEAREDNTGGHVFRIRELTREICERMNLSPDEIEDISFSSMMHDIGKIQIPDNIFLKPGPFNYEENSIMQEHCVIGERMLGDKPLYKTAREIARSHHEWWDGTGFPDGLKGDSIPLSARITAIADAFDALTHERCYKKTWPIKMAIYEMKALSGRQFDPEAFEAFLEIQAGEKIINNEHRVICPNYYSQTARSA